MILYTILQVATESLTQTATSVPASELKFSYFDLFLKGGIIMIPIVLLSLLAVYIYVERIFAIRKAAKQDVNFMHRIKDYIHNDQLDAAISLCKATDSPSARMIEKGLSRIGRPLSDINAAIENVGKSEIAKLEKGFALLATAAGGAPMLGFLGTVTGMITAFYDMSMAGNNIDIQLLSKGIYEALVTTVAGLIVGVMAYFMYNYIVSRLDHVIDKLENTTTEFMDILNEPAK